MMPRWTYYRVVVGIVPDFDLLRVVLKVESLLKSLSHLCTVNSPRLLERRLAVNWATLSCSANRSPVDDCTS
jgi:hypothetical protein